MVAAFRILPFSFEKFAFSSCLNISLCFPWLSIVYTSGLDMMEILGISGIQWETQSYKKNCSIWLVACGALK